MAVPKKKVSHSRKRIRNSAKKLSEVHYIVCPNCSFLKLKHHVCKACGYFKDGLIYSKGNH
uniref:Ribosomal protein L32 n=1 Tax=Seculamonas ecuadoriensis TaxID=221724 RepID=M4QAX5_SECEC|nr:ribosomal protein L32 [Seculamonas ecuadoriensis]AGH24466.1 ribosomal protein L32 [Seculamonas ecuadoriensis]